MPEPDSDDVWCAVCDGFCAIEPCNVVAPFTT